MKVTAEKNEKIAKMIFSSVYPHSVNKVEKKGRSKDELHQEWLTGIEEIDFELTRQVRYLDKLVDELARGHKMEKIL